MVNIYFPCDSNMLLAVAEKCYKSTNQINAIIAGKQPAATWLTLDEARAELEKGAAEWKWASTAASNDEAQIVLACAGDVPTQEIMAAADKLNEMGIKFKVVNVVDLIKLQSAKENDEALTDEEFAEIFTADKPVLFAYHSYAHDVRGLIFDRPNHDNFNVHGYKEQGSTTHAVRHGPRQRHRSLRARCRGSAHDRRREVRREDRRARGLPHRSLPVRGRQRLRIIRTTPTGCTRMSRPTSRAPSPPPPPPPATTSDDRLTDTVK